MPGLAVAPWGKQKRLELKLELKAGSWRWLASWWQQLGTTTNTVAREYIPRRKRKGRKKEEKKVRRVGLLRVPIVQHTRSTRGTSLEAQVQVLLVCVPVDGVDSAEERPSARSSADDLFRTGQKAEQEQRTRFSVCAPLKGSGAL